jgi:hypothetical protein
VSDRTPDTPRPKPIALFAAQALVMALLLGWWPTPRELVPPLMRAQAAPLLDAGIAGALTLRPSDAKEEGVDTLMEATDEGARTPRWRAELSLVRLGWWPFAVLTALVLATPMRPGRRAFALAAGFLWIEVYVLLRLYSEAGFADYEAKMGPGGVLAGPLHAVLRSGAEILEANVVLVAVVLIAWAVLARPAGALDASALRRAVPARSR